tara:strand:- start:297 stop:854 length:558 start_codon:yes stop_codon:yes gene_type:complete
MDGSFSFMRSGLGNDVIDTGPDVDSIRMIVSLMTILMEEATHSGAKFAKACGRTLITSRDVVAALKYEAHFFWEKKFDERVLERFQEERRHTYETDEDTDEESNASEYRGSGDEAQSDDAENMREEDETYTENLCDPQLCEFHTNVLRVCREWPLWTPTDPAKLLLKNAIDKTERSMLETSCDND